MALSAGTIAGTMFQGDFPDVQVPVGPAEYRPWVPLRAGATPGDRVTLCVESRHVFILPE